MITHPFLVFFFLDNGNETLNSVTHPPTGRQIFFSFFSFSYLLFKDIYTTPSGFIVCAYTITRYGLFYIFYNIHNTPSRLIVCEHTIKRNGMLYMLCIDINTIPSRIIACMHTIIRNGMVCFLSSLICVFLKK